MKLRVSLVALAALASVASASGLTLYEDITTKQIFTEPGENRQKLGSFVQENNVVELMNKEVKGVSVSSGAVKLELHGTHYLGFTSNSYSAVNNISGATSKDGTLIGGGSSSAGFEMRRNYLDFKAHFADSKDYVRLTLDATKELETSTGAANPKIKYAYLYLDNILPYTGVEMGSVHRPWIDYEESNSWYFRSINKVILEDKFATTATSTWTGSPKYDVPGLLTSADLGVDFKVKSPYVSSEFGVFNGQSYDGTTNNNNQNSTKLSYEARVTAHILGNGNANVNKWKDEYLNVSIAGMQNNNAGNKIDPGNLADYKREGYWIHAVYNQPMFLIAAQYNDLQDKYYNSTGANQQSPATSDKKYKMYSI
ncbi:MAG: hypothetical protein JHC37_03920, partial [Campylobacteraceae bacterium]|nr:hypothetical protein [Campylobacteraceae bacterium]